MNAVDTNVLVYVDDFRDVRKQRIAEDLVDSLQDGVLLWQAACEYLNVIRRAREFVHPQAPVIDRALVILGRYSLSFWDSLPVAACIHAGGERLYTEDFDAYPRIDGLEIINPFA